MSDLTARLEAHLQNDDAALRHWDADNLIEEAQAEIERLNGELHAQDKLWDTQLGDAHAEIKRLRSCLKWEQNWLSRVGTHSDGCWQWGPEHYQCAVRHIKDLEQNPQRQEWRL